jgi:biotin-[acetyl-CoA-carboxylase] ligase BirA-like protein
VFVLTDNPERIEGLVGTSAGWRQEHVRSLAAADRLLWHALGPGTKPWTTRIVQPATGRLWERAVLVQEATASQFDALRNLMGCEPEVSQPTVAVALRGRNFHGHRGRTWVAVEGNLHLCVALRPRAEAARIGLALTMLPVVAVAEAIRSASARRLRPGIKWVNDVLLEGRKVAGVLTATQAQGTELALVVLGVGLNVASAPPVAATPFVPRVGCLQRAPGGEGLALSVMFWAVLEALADRYRSLLAEGPGPLLTAYRQLSLVAGRAVRVWPEEGTNQADPARWPPPAARGVVRSIGADLALELEGQSQLVAKGRLAFEEDCHLFGL